MSSSSARAVVVGHAGFASGLVSAVEQITGSGALFVPLSSATHSAASMEDMVRDVLVDRGIRVVFTDLPAGSATMAVRRLQRTIPDLTVVTGANLAVLLDFVKPGVVVLEGERHNIELDDAGRAVEKGKASMMVFGRHSVD
jgi:PTS system N-acetylgalactosamine-specific IIA component